MSKITVPLQVQILRNSQAIREIFEEYVYQRGMGADPAFLSTLFFKFYDSVENDAAIDLYRCVIGKPVVTGNSYRYEPNMFRTTAEDYVVLQTHTLYHLMEKNSAYNRDVIDKMALFDLSKIEILPSVTGTEARLSPEEIKEVEDYLTDLPNVLEDESAVRLKARSLYKGPCFG